MKRTRPQTLTTAAAVLTAAAVFVALPGCSPSVTLGAKTDKDDLRREARDADQRAALAEAEADELRAKLAESERARLGALDQDVLEALPRVAGITVTSAAVLPDADDPDLRVVVASVRPFDGRRRFVQTVGRLTVELMTLSESLVSDPPPPERLGLLELSPAEVRDAYRTGIGGTGYQVRFSQIDAAALEGRTLVVRAELSDLVTGQTHRAASND